MSSAGAPSWQPGASPSGGPSSTPGRMDGRPRAHVLARRDGLLEEPVEVAPEAGAVLGRPQGRVSWAQAWSRCNRTISVPRRAAWR